MNKKDDEIAHPGMLSKPEKHLILAQFTNSPWTPAKNALDIVLRLLYYYTDIKLGFNLSGSRNRSVDF